MTILNTDRKMLKRNHCADRVPVIQSVRIICCWLFSAFLVTAQNAYVEPPTSLAGSWQFAPDYTDAGINLQWFMRPLPAYRMQLPGIVQAQNFGSPISTNTPWVLSLYDRYWYLRDEYKQYATRNVKVPFLSQPPRHFLGITWFQREINVTPYWATRRVVLTLERPHWETTVWVDGNKIDPTRVWCAARVRSGSLTRAGIASPFASTTACSCRIDRMLTASQTLWAAAGTASSDASIHIHRPGLIDDAQAFPNLAQRTLLVKVRIGNVTGRSGTGTLFSFGPTRIVP